MKSENCADALVAKKNKFEQKMTSPIEKRVLERMPGMIETAITQAIRAPLPYPAQSSSFACINAEQFVANIAAMEHAENPKDLFVDMADAFMEIEARVRFKRMLNPLVVRELLVSAVYYANKARGEDDQLTVEQFAPEKAVDNDKGVDAEDEEIDAVLPEGISFELFRSSNKTIRDEIVYAIQNDVRKSKEAEEFVLFVLEKFKAKEPSISDERCVEFLCCVIASRVAMLLQWTFMNGQRDARIYADENFGETS